jgi:hypothetical protein
MTDQQKKIPIWFWVVAVLLLLWNLVGVANFIAQLTITEEALQDMPEVDRNFIGNYPVWTFVAFGIAVFGGVLGSIALLLKKKIAKQLFIASLIGIVVQFSYSLSIALSMKVYVARIVGMAILLIGIGIFAIRLSKNGAKKQWLT